VTAINACNKNRQSQSDNNGLQTTEQVVGQPLEQNAPQTKVVTVFDIGEAKDGTTHVAFRELAEAFRISDPAVISVLKKAFQEQSAVSITFDPWLGVVKQASAPTATQSLARVSGPASTYLPGASHMVDPSAMNQPNFSDPVALGILNTTTTGLINVIPDWATAQQMFDYIEHQCCALPGPYAIDHCISFQYCEDGCYARAHKMCWILNNTYHYATHKVFSFAYPTSTYTLSVKAEKWGGCCINWWYHVAPLVNIKTPSGIKAYVFDPAMFDQPVLLATWLHAQENPACAGGNGKVTSFNIQPTTSYWPSDTAHFGTDPAYANTNSTLISYAPLKTCP